MNNPSNDAQRLSMRMSLNLRLSAASPSSDLVNLSGFKENSNQVCRIELMQFFIV